MRAALVASRLLSAQPAALTASLEINLLQRLYRILELGFASQAVKAGLAARLPEDARQAALELLELAVRMLTVVVTKTPGALDRLVGRCPRVVELTEGVVPPALAEPAVPFADLARRLLRLVHATRREEHVGPDEEKGTPSRLRGNLALLFTALSQAQAVEDAPPALRSLDLSPVVDDFIGLLRKERGSAQNNIGVCVTWLAKNPRYVQRVRDLNGIESLHQIQLPRAEKEKTEAMRLHRLRGPVGLKGLD
jgi:hypothetical protein